MAAKYWLKMYHEALHDPKLASLPNNLWRRFWECCLMAGELDEGGFLPDLNGIAWTVRVSEDTLRAEFGQLAQAGFIELKLDGTNERWFVSNFAKRQAPSSDAQRMKEYRKRLREEKKKETDTDYRYILNSNSNVTPVTKRNENTYIHPDPEPIVELKTALSQITKTPLWVKTEEEYDQAAHLLNDKAATYDKVSGFLSWWKTNGYYPGKPTLTSLIGEWDNYTAGMTIEKNGSRSKNGSTQTPAPAAADLVSNGKGW